MNRILENAFRLYPDLVSKFNKLIEQQSTILDDNGSNYKLEVLPDNEGLRIEVFGKTINIEFSMIRSDTNDFRGQLTAKHIQMIDNSVI